MKFAVLVRTHIHIPVFEYLCSCAVLDTCSKLSCVVFGLCYFECAISVSLALHPRSNVLCSIGLKLLSDALLKAMSPLSFVNYIIGFSQIFDDTVSLFSVVLELSRVGIFSRLILVAPTYFHPFT